MRLNRRNVSSSRQRLYSRRQVTGGAAALCATALLSYAAAGATGWKLLGQKTPHFKAPLLGGGMFRSREFPGRFLFIDFWGLWCPPCIANAPNVQELHESLGTEPKIKFLALHCGPEKPGRKDSGKWSNVAEFAAAMGLTYEIGLDPNMKISRGFRVPSFPSYVLIAPDRTALLWRTSADADNWQGLRRDILIAVIKHEWSNLGSTSFRSP